MALIDLLRRFFFLLWLALLFSQLKEVKLQDCMADAVCVRARGTLVNAVFKAYFFLPNFYL